jgi:hypothetical protein
MELTPNNNTAPKTSPGVRSFFKKWWIDYRDRIEEWYRIYFHTITVTILLFVNLWLGCSSLMIYFAQWFGVDSGPVGLLSVFSKHPSGVLLSLLNTVYVPLHYHLYIWIIVVLNLPIFTWLYSTTTQPIVKGHNALISWTSKRGRKAAAIMSGISFILHFNAVFAWYVRNYLFDFFASIRSDKDYLVVTSMESFGYVLMCVPVLICLYAVYFVAKEFYRDEDIRELFYNWVFKLLASQSYSLRGKSCDVIIGWEEGTNKPIVLNEKSRYLHELITGPTGSGKTSTTILIRIVQDLIRIARGRKLGVVVLEPKGDLVRDVLKLCKQLGIPDHKIKVVDPTDLVRSIKFNPFAGPLEEAAARFSGVLDSLTGDQDDFFKGQQNETATLYTMLGKLRYANLFNISHLQRMYTDPRYLATITEETRERLNTLLNSPNLTPEEKSRYQRYERVVAYFEDEVLDYKTHKVKDVTLPLTYPPGHKYKGLQVVDSKKDKYVTGAKKYLNEIVMNAMLSELMVANDGEEVLDIDQFLQDGGVLLVNSALGELEELSLSFGQFFIRQFQSSVFRRPPEEGGISRIPIFFYIDEFPLYINEAFIRLLTLGRSYKVGTLIAIQSLGQLKVVVPGYDNTIMNSARNKTVFGGGEYEDNLRFSRHFGEEYQMEESLNESTTPISMPQQGWGLRYNTQRKLMPRFTPTQIKEQKFKHFIVDLVDPDGNPLPPVKAYGKFITETKFIRKYVNVGRIVLETKTYKPLSAIANKMTHVTLLRQLFESKEDGETQHVVDVTPEQPEVEMLPTAPVTQLIPGEAVESQEITQREAGTNPALTAASPRTTSVVDDEEELPLNAPLRDEGAGDKQPENPSGQQLLALTPEEEAEYQFYKDDSGVASVGYPPGENETGLVSVEEDDPAQQHRDVVLPEAMEESLNDLFKRIGYSSENHDENADAVTVSDEEGENDGFGWQLEDIVAGNPTAASEVPDAAFVDDPKVEADQETDTPEKTESPAQNGEPMGQNAQTDLDPEIFDLVAPERRNGSRQRAIASASIKPLSDTQVDDD